MDIYTMLIQSLKAFSGYTMPQSNIALDPKYLTSISQVRCKVQS